MDDDLGDVFGLFQADIGPGLARIIRTVNAIAIADVAPTMLHLLGLNQPAEMSGHSLVS